MPRQVLLSRVPVDMSIVEFNPDAGEDLFLTYTWERREGPDIQRTGKGPPYMRLIGGEPRQTTTHAFGLRLGTWLMQEAMRQDELAEAQQALATARARAAPAEDLRVLQDTVAELPAILAHDAVFTQCYPNHDIIAQQGCGDLTMNAWNVAYVNNPLGQLPPTLVCMPHEPVDDRTYACLVKWHAAASGAGPLTIEEVQFRRPGNVRESNEMVWVRFGDTWLPRGDRIAFAVSNQQVIRDGAVVPVVTTCEQFGDLRHLLQMPNLNPDGPLYAGEPPGARQGYRPRQYFNKPQHGDIWLGEADFLEDTTRNLCRAALAGPVFLAAPSGADTLRMRGAMANAGYREVSSPLLPLAPGEWRFVPRGPQTAVVEVFFKRNTYGWTMLGLSPDNRRLLWLACTGIPGKTGYTLEQAADILRRAGAWNALLIDEGGDVFQKVRWDGGPFMDMVPALRRRVRATFLVARPRQMAG